MSKLLFKLPVIPVLFAILFLLIQIFSDLFIPMLTANIVNEGILKGNSDFIYRQGFIMVGVAVVSYLAAEINIFLSNRISASFGAALREELFSKTLELSNDAIDAFTTPSLITRITNDVKQVQSLVEMMMKFLILAPLYVVGGMVLSMRLNVTLALPFVWVAPLIAAISILISRSSNPYFVKVQASFDSLNLIFREGLNGTKIIRAFNKQLHENKRYSNVNQHHTEMAIKANTLSGCVAPIMSLIMGLSVLVITWIGAKNDVEVGSIMGVISYGSQISLGMLLVSSVITSVPRGSIAAKRINKVLETESDLNNNSWFQSESASLELHGVSYAYKGASDTVLEDINLSVNKNETLAIIGSTGSGKSSLLNLMSGLYQPLSGTILVDKGAVSLKNISYAPQSSMLFQGTLRENLMMADPEASDEAMWEALVCADADSFISDLDIEIAKDGNNFSGGQKQRLCIARTVLKPASIYLFDDSFSALDYKTDRLIRENLTNYLHDAVIVIVAQRLNTIQDANTIIVLRDGHIVGEGTHDILKKENLTYKEIISSQTKGGMYESKR